MLEVRDLHVYYGEIHALKGVSFSVAEGEIVTLLGNNGAGKTTTLRALSGLLAPRTGDVRLDRTSLLSIAPARHRAEGHHPRAGGPPHLQPAQRDREPRDGRLHSLRPRHRPGHGAGLCHIPSPQGAARPGGGHAVGRRAADARDRARAHGEAQAPPARRALHGPGARARRADLRDGPDHQQARRDHPARRAERRHGAVHRRRGGTSSRPAASRSRAAPPSWPTTPRCGAPTWARREAAGYRQAQLHSTR